MDDLIARLERLSSVDFEWPCKLTREAAAALRAAAEREKELREALAEAVDYAAISSEISHPKADIHNMVAAWRAILAKHEKPAAS